MIVSLLASLIRTETISKRVKHAPPKKRASAKTKIGENNESFENQMYPNLNSNRNELVDLADPKRSRGNGMHSDVLNSKIRRSRTNSATSGTRFLAQKLANDALKSAKMQETMKKLTNVKTPEMGIYETVRTPAAKATKTKGPAKKSREPTRRKGRKKKKGRSHRRRFRKRSRWPKRGSAQNAIDAGKVSGKGESKSRRMIVNTNRPEIKKQTKKATTTPLYKVRIIQLDREDYVDSTSTLSTKTSLMTITPKIDELSEHLDKSESMIERLMKTTTRDPAKKKLGDQGAEYSEYYNDDDVLEDMAANKIQMNDRFTRQTISNSSLYNQIAGTANVRPYLRDFNEFDRVPEYDDNFPSYPAVDQSLDLHENSRNSHADSSFNYASNYATVLDDEMPVDDEFDAATVSNVDTNIFDRPETRNVNGESQQTVENVGRYSKKLDYSNEDVHSELRGHAPILDVKDVDSQISDKNAFAANAEDDETPRNSDLAYRQILRPTFRRNTMTPPKMERTKANEFQQSAFQSPSQSDRLYARPREQNFHGQSNEHPATSLANAMQQPFGEVLKSLGINVQSTFEDSSGDFQSGLNANADTSVRRDVAQKANSPRPPFSRAALGRAIEGISGDDQLRYGRNDARGRNDGDNNLRLAEPRVPKPVEGFDLGEGYSTSEEKKIGEENLLPITEEDRNANADRSNVSVAANETKEIANQILGRIMDELEDLKIDHSKNNKREGLPCRLSGSWLTTRAGIKLDMRVVNRSIIVHLKELIPPLPAEVLFNSSWNMTGHAPFRMGAPFSLIATNNHTKSMAVFIGACRVCQGIDTIAGVWSIARQPKDCRDFQIATDVFNDMFRKTRLSSTSKEEEQLVTQAGSSKAENTTRTSRSGKGS